MFYLSKVIKVYQLYVLVKIATHMRAVPCITKYSRVQPCIAMCMSCCHVEPCIDIYSHVSPCLPTMYCLALPCMYGHVIAMYSHVINAINGNTSINMTILGYTVEIHGNMRQYMANMGIYGNTWLYMTIH